MEKYLVGQIVKAQGLDGTVKIKIFTDSALRFKNINKVLLNENNYYTNFKYLRDNSGFVYAKIDGITNRTEAENIRNTKLYIFKEDMYNLNEDEYFISDLIGISVIDEENNHIGTIKDVEQFGATDILVVQTLEGEFSIPFISEIVKEVDVKNDKFIINKTRFDEVKV